MLDSTPPPDLIYDNGDSDGVNGLSSERDTAVPLASTADDFVVPQGPSWAVREIWVLIYEILWQRRLEQSDVLIYRAGPLGEPPQDARLILERLDVPTEDVASRCEPDGRNLRELHITLDTPAVLTPGRYFLVVRGVGAGPDEGQRAFWATTGNGTVRWDRGWFQSEYFGFPEWTPVDDPRILGVPSDFAFRLLGEVQTLPGDFDGDGDIDIADFSFFSACFGGSGVPCDADCCDADLDSDGDVDIADFAIFSANFTGSQ